MSDHLKNESRHFLSHFEESLDGYLSSMGQSKLTESLSYSLKSSGKRFRPFLAYLIGKTKGKSFEAIKSWCLAIEFIHTYSLIHDDLPCMDNDDYRRGVLTNHKVFGEAIALLAGDSLISEAFRVIAEDRSLSSAVKVKLIELLAQKIGPHGMVGGQVLDMQTLSQLPLEELKNLHILKTGNLIQAAAVGAAEILEFTTDEVLAVQNFSLHLGLAFQIQDDLLDFDSEKQDFKNYAHLLGIEIARAELETQSNIALSFLPSLSDSVLLKELVEFNLSRKK
ncbi:MAG: hypothetical protein A2622_06345 [Bdellovibrionales bacterium RIFCSPHIGHO2_01_FULL_40_29]|nr:MAG: hypothetical protein A2622_06345 [Bdellovibrionales bacterium RIFCSPHIGHO2_01_FULL_40_29]OFZ35065.1 MAG: hypothetical protein A3D17_06695 [Bdellovibrionales bacterium RIFCSPHIGHO2_02_FULL_40_15]